MCITANKDALFCLFCKLQFRRQAVPSLESVWCLFIADLFCIDTDSAAGGGVGKWMDWQEEEVHLHQDELAVPGAREQHATSIPTLHSQYAGSSSHAEKLFFLP